MRKYAWRGKKISRPKGKTNKKIYDLCKQDHGGTPRDKRGWNEISAPIVPDRRDSRCCQKGSVVEAI